MSSSPHWQVGLSWFREKLSPANREQRLSRWADFAKNCLPRIGSKELPRFREKYRVLRRQKMGSNMRPRYIQFRDIRDRDISGLHCIMQLHHSIKLLHWSRKMPYSVTHLHWHWLRHLMRRLQYLLLKCVGKCLNCQMIGHYWPNCTAWWVDFHISHIILTWLTNGNPSKYIPLHTRTSTNVRCAYSCLGNWSVNDVITVVTRTSWLSKPMV